MPRRPYLVRRVRTSRARGHTDASVTKFSPRAVRGSVQREQMSASERRCDEHVPYRQERSGLLMGDPGLEPGTSSYQGNAGVAASRLQ
jgi:hypothetical protein